MIQHIQTEAQKKTTHTSTYEFDAHLFQSHLLTVFLFFNIGRTSRLKSRTSRCSHDARKTGVPQGNSRHADPQNRRARPHSRLRHLSAHPANFQGFLSGPAGLALSRASPPRRPRVAHRRLARLGNRARCKILYAYQKRPQAVGNRTRALGAALRCCSSYPANRRIGGASMHWLRRLLNKEQSEKQLDAELRFHIERQISDYVAAGMTPQEARRRAQLDFGGLELIKQATRESRRANWADEFRQDVTFGVRILRKNLGFTLAAAATLALGIGANTAIFSIVNATVLRPLPLKDSARILSVSTEAAMFPGFSLGNSWPAFQLIRSQASSFEECSVFSQSDKTMTGQAAPEQISVTAVSGGFFEEVGANVQQGRLFTRADESPGQTSVAVLSDAFWRTQFGADPSVIGRSLVLDKQPYR